MAAQSVLLGNGTITLVDKSVTPNVPVPVVMLQDISIDFGFETKTLDNEYQYPLAHGRTGQKVKIKAKSGDVNGALIAKILGGTPSTGQELVITATATAASSITPTIPGSGTWAQDLGVRSSTGALMNPVASSPAAGISYTVSAGVYGFHASETGTVSFRIAYTDTTTGKNFEVTNPLIQASTSFEGVFFNTFTQNDGSVSTSGYRFYALACDKLAIGSKRDAYTEVDLEFTVLARASDNKVFKRWGN